MTNRRSILSLVMLVGTGAALAPQGDFFLTKSPLAALDRRLRAHSASVRTSTAADGILELHCGMENAVRWAQGVGHLAEGGGKVRAQGNSLSFVAAGQPVRVILHTLSATA